MITKNELKYFSSLLIKKYRQQEKKFLVEGIKLTEEGLNCNYECEIIFATNDFNEKNEAVVSTLKKNFRIEIIKSLDFKRLSDTMNPQGIITVFKMKKDSIFNINKINSNFIVAMENISDPGNLGTIIRNCDWFGVKDILISKDSVEIYNPKVVRSTMGSLFHLNIYTEIDIINELLPFKTKGYQFVCADLKGESIYDFKSNDKIILFLSNEANGPSQELLKISDKKIAIPKFGIAESLNVASASAVIIAELIRKSI
jgi:TrmH family RNA methyltransferase